MTNDATRCRENAEQLRSLAAKEINSVEKQQLLHIADEWLRRAQSCATAASNNTGAR